jgi:hypothetical protein
VLPFWLYEAVRYCGINSGSLYFPTTVFDCVFAGLRLIDGSSGMMRRLHRPR